MAKDNKTVGDAIDATEDKVISVGTPIMQKQVVQKPNIYNTIDEVPEVFRPAVRAALKKVGFNGKRLLTEDSTGNLNLTDEKLWVINMCYNGGMYR